MAKTPNSDAKKATIYVDVDDEITVIIDKLVSVPQKITALVLPKRAKVLQSIVNMRLLKRAADQHKKSLVLITTETGLMPLAGAVGVHVARSLTSKPVIPEVASTPADEVANEAAEEVVLNPSTPVGEHSDGQDQEESPEPPPVPPVKSEEETVELGDEADDAPSSSDKKPKKDKKLAVPSFDKFRTRLLLAGLGLIVLGVLWYLAVVVMPKGTITIRTETSSASSTQDVTAIAGLAKVDVEKKQLALVSKTTKTTQTDKFQATGQKDVGTKATGKMTIVNCGSDNVNLAAGTRFTNGSFTFVTDEAVTIPVSNFYPPNHPTYPGQCKSDISQTTNVTAESPGDKYNLSSRSYGSQVSGVTGSGTSMSGGTSKILKVVSNEDIETAKKAVLAKSNDAVKTDLSTQLSKANALAASDTFAATAGTVTTSVKADEEATGDVTITVEVIYTMSGVANSDISDIMKPEILKQIDSGKQQFVSDIAKSTKIKLTNKKSDTEMVFSASTNLTIGAKIDAEALKKQMAGIKAWDAERTIKALPGVKDASVKLSPFWVHNIPKKAGKITVVTVDSDGKTSN